MGLLDTGLSPNQLGLLYMGLGMLQNNRNPSFGAALGAGGLQGLQGMQEAQALQRQSSQLEQMNKLRDIQMQVAQAKLSGKPTGNAAALHWANLGDRYAGLDPMTGEEKVKYPLSATRTAELTKGIIESGDGYAPAPGWAASNAFNKGAEKSAQERNTIVDMKTPEGRQRYLTKGEAAGLPDQYTAIADALLPSLIQTESGGNPNAVSPVGAKGLTQIMPGTGVDPGYGVAPMKDNSPEEQRRFGRDYLAAMMRETNGNVPAALSAYNQGLANLQKNGINNPGYVNGILKRPPVLGQSTAEEMAQKEIGKAKGENIAALQEKTRIIDNRLKDIDAAMEALAPRKDLSGNVILDDSGTPKGFGFEAGGFGGGSGLIPNKFFDLTNNEQFRTLQRVAKGEELQKAVTDMAKQGQITEAERALLSLAVGLDPETHRSSQIYSGYQQAKQRLSEYRDKLQSQYGTRLDEAMKKHGGK